ncbi:MAG: efflux RND transporter periplasmic adaptor subunit [Myxococcota bacterium]
MRPPIMIALLLSACASSRASVPEPARVVETLQVQPAERASMPLPGRVRARLSSTVAFEVGGVVEDVLVLQGERVDEGQVLARLERRSLRLAQTARAAELRSAQASLADAERRHARFSNLVGSGAASQADLDAALAALEVGRSRVDMARSSLALSREQLRDGSLRAPYAGLIGDRSIEPGQSVAPGVPAFFLVGEGTKEIRVHVPERLVDRLDESAVHQARIVASGRSVGTRHVSTASEASNDGTYEVRFEFDDADVVGSGAVVRSGATAEVDVQLRDPDRGYAIPPTAFGRGAEGGAFVYVVEDGIVRRRGVELAPGASPRVLQGLRGDETIVRRGLAFLSEGQPVRVRGALLSAATP